MRSNNEKAGGRGKISNNVKFAVGITVSLIFLFLAARNVDFKKIPETLVRVDYLLYSLSMLVYLFSFSVKALQVKIMLSFKTKLRLLPLVPPVIIGYYSNNIFPLKAGEVVRTTIIARKNSMPFWSVFSALLLERSLDLVFVLLIALLVSFFISFPTEVLVSIRGFIFFLIFFFAFFIVLAVMARRTGSMPAVLTRLLPEKIRAYLRTTIGRFADGLWAVKKPAPLFGTLAVGLVFWAVNLFGYYLRLRAFDLPCSPSAVGFLLVVVGLGVSIPSAPSYIGVYHLLVIFALGFFNVGKDEAFSFALFSHAFDFVFVAILGNISIVIEGVSLKALKKSVATKQRT